jgi:competence protein ComEA
MAEPPPPSPERRPAAIGLPALVLILLAAWLLDSASRSSEPQGPPAPTPRLRIDPNTAPAPALAALPEIGPTRASAILRAREDAPFASGLDLERRVKGIGPATLRKIEPYLRFD